MTSMLSAVQEDRRSASIAGLAKHGGRVGVTRLVLTDFRNYRSARLELDPDPVVLSGLNGAGKTNLLEAMSFLSPGRGLRNARLTDIDRRDGGEASASGWAVAATLATRRGSLAIGTGRIGAEGERRTVRIDSEPAKSQAALGERLGVLWLTPQMDRLFIEGPAGRRRLLDRLVLGLDPAHGARAASLRSRRLSCRERHCRRGGVDRRAKGAVDRDPLGPGPVAARGARRAAAVAARRGRRTSRRHPARRTLRGAGRARKPGLD